MNVPLSFHYNPTHYQMLSFEWLKTASSRDVAPVKEDGPEGRGLEHDVGKAGLT